MQPTDYALITGASEGLGKALALECAERGIPMVLVALPGSGLAHTANFIQNHFGVVAHAIETDLSEEANCFALHRQVQGLGCRIGILVNNAGMGGTFYFHQRSTGYYSRLIRLNTLAPTLLSRLFLDDLLAAAPAHILNVSSLAALFPLPQKQVYGGTKSYLLAFSRSLRRELRPPKVYVSALCPGAINTSWRLILANRTGTWLGRRSTLEPQVVAKAAIEGMLRKKARIVPGRINRLLLQVSNWCPGWLQDRLTAFQQKSFKAEVVPLPTSHTPFSQPQNKMYETLVLATVFLAA
ncbi:hypothetical protein SAMN05444008_11792 [Cnuella takakiae]|uniref:Short-chain dehydrogenase n=1 Tax=Cnuella takakiae TaxID=1302690 RepID=A0A1M5GWY7_9BACT|nr:SDR family NAD(P)-dependent oxidoreductase [Cnuella takakiae]OLY90859.1 hypothetical protein BUE76_02325 [Cnuella takakiae]SHG08198.1 hypothetical protein SAMN05444008_11792 [Cnuella takakiae]